MKVLDLCLILKNKIIPYKRNHRMGGAECLTPKLPGVVWCNGTPDIATVYISSLLSWCNFIVSQAAHNHHFPGR